MQTWLLKMAAEFSHRKDQLVFLINNYDMILSVVAVSYEFYIGDMILLVVYIVG